MLDTETRTGNGESMLMGYMYNQPLISTSEDAEKIENTTDVLHQEVDKSPASSPGKYYDNLINSTSFRLNTDKIM